MLQREDAIREMIRNGHERRHIIETLHRKFNVNPRTIQDQYYALSKQVGEELSVHKDEIAMIIIERKNELYKLCIKQNKFKTADDILNGIAKMAGLFDPKGAISREVPKINIIEADFSEPLKAVGDDSEATND